MTRSLDGGRKERGAGVKEPTELMDGITQRKRVKSMPKSVPRHRKLKRNLKEAQTWRIRQASPRKEGVFLIHRWREWALTLSLLRRNLPDNWRTNSGILPECWSSYQWPSRCGSLQHTRQYLKHKKKGGKWNNTPSLKQRRRRLCSQTQAGLPIGCQDVTSRGAGAVVTARDVGAAVGTGVTSRTLRTLVNVWQEAETSGWHHQMRLGGQSQAWQSALPSQVILSVSLSW